MTKQEFFQKRQILDFLRQGKLTRCPNGNAKTASITWFANKRKRRIGTEKEKIEFIFNKPIKHSVK